MSEDRLEEALHEMTHEAVDAATLGAARVRVWDKLLEATADPCAEFRPDFRAYLSGALAGSRRVLLEDHRQPLLDVPRRPGRDEGRGPGDRHAASVVVALATLGSAGGGCRAGAGGHVCRSRHDRRLDGARRTPGDGGVRQRRRVRPARRHARRRCRDRRAGTHPHGPGSARRTPSRGWIDGRCQRANGAVRDRRLERPGHSPAARRRHRSGRQAAPRRPARSHA